MAHITAKVSDEQCFNELKELWLSCDRGLKCRTDEPVGQKNQTAYGDEGESIGERASKKKVKNIRDPAFAKDSLLLVERKDSFQRNKNQSPYYQPEQCIPDHEFSYLTCTMIRRTSRTKSFTAGKDPSALLMRFR